ncbi:PP0621 family protein [Bordetella genomosp. 13]|uniref:PP0621 family protein n=1 Tax=Bordetella genomosp. 13 TaxID=463040 RepID=UPI0011A5B8A5|nr:PP0621 family protein [Bordetella genomosp. 13]
MGKLIFWVLIVLAALVAWRIVNARAAARMRDEQRGSAARGAGPRGGSSGKAALPAESMVRCAHCGIHLPRSEALLTNGSTWCSPEHARLGPQKT